jgi:hypothetical protein
MVFSDSSRVWAIEAHQLTIRPSSPTQRSDMFRPWGVQHQVHRALGPDRPVVGGVPAHQDLVVSDDAVKMRPDDNLGEDEDEQDDKTSVSAWENVSALGGTRTPNLLIRRDIQPRPLPAHLSADLLKSWSTMRSERRH